MDDQKKNYYNILDIPINSTPEQIYNAYLRQKQTYAEENLAIYSLFKPEECDKNLNLIEEAFEIIGDSEKRRQYDHARGFNIHGAQDLYEKKEPAQDPLPEKRISKLVAQKKFSLHFQVDEEMEKEIESTTEFSGEFLKRIREYKKVDIPRLSDMTKISKYYLKNIEEENRANLPALVYIRGFIYQIAKCLKLNPEIVANSYTNRMKNK
jgi:curved DNA-binding protein CbpA